MLGPRRNPFLDENGAPRILGGVNIYSGSARFAEMAGHMGFDVVWIDMEHACHGLRDAEAMCVAVEAGGAIPLIRTMGSERDHILRALEIGGRIIVVPMVNEAATARRVVEFGKYRPLGARGFYKVSRGLRFGADPDWMSTENETTVLLPQIETLHAVENLDGILGVKGVGGVLIGPGDLSADLGRPGRFNDPELMRIICETLRRTRAAGLHAAVLTPVDSMLPAVLDAGADLVIHSADLSAVRSEWGRAVAVFQAAVRGKTA